MTTVRKELYLVLCLAPAIAYATGCHHTPKPLIDTELGPSSSKGAAEIATTQGLPPVDISADFAKGSLKPIHFDYDSYALRPDALATLKANVDELKAHTDVLVRVEGNCDERGTQEFNMALGDKRAQTTREQMIRLGISGDRIITLSYGKENPVDPGHDESAWAKNRRCEFSEGHKTGK